MIDDQALSHRRSIRLRDYDYRWQGAYFVTICTLNRECLFGIILDDIMCLNAFGQVAESEWLRSAQMRREVTLDEFSIMPNHLHGIVFITDGSGPRHNTTGEAAPYGRPPDAPTNMDRGGRHLPTPTSRPASRSLGALINGYKAAVTRTVRSMRGTSCLSLWQRNYYEHVIRNDHDLDRIRQYIRDNPARCALDHENPNCTLLPHP